MPKRFRLSYEERLTSPFKRLANFWEALNAVHGEVSQQDAIASVLADKKPTRALVLRRVARLVALVDECDLELYVGREELEFYEPIEVVQTAMERLCLESPVRELTSIVTPDVVKRLRLTEAVMRPIWQEYEIAEAELTQALLRIEELRLDISKIACGAHGYAMGERLLNRAQDGLLEYQFRGIAGIRETLAMNLYSLAQYRKTPQNRFSSDAFDKMTEIAFLTSCLDRHCDDKGFDVATYAKLLKEGLGA